MKMNLRLRLYIIDSSLGWFVVKAANARIARSVGREEFGASSIRSVRRATDEEARSYVNQKGLAGLHEIESVP